MKLNNLICISSNVSLTDYLNLYKYVRDNMLHPEWLGTFTKEEIIDILNHDGKIWLYYDKTTPVCSMFYIVKLPLILTIIMLSGNIFFINSI